MANIRTLAIRQAAVTMLADVFDKSGAPFTCAASVVGVVLAQARNLAPGTDWTPDRLALRAADEIHRRRAAITG